jgi:hypothetical protein
MMPQAVDVARTRTGSVMPQVAGMIGNVLEWYDFAAYGFLAATFAANFVTGQVGGVVRPSGDWRSDAPVRL